MIPNHHFLVFIVLISGAVGKNNWWFWRQPVIPTSVPFKGHGESQIHDPVRCLLKTHGQSIIGKMHVEIFDPVILSEIWT